MIALGFVARAGSVPDPVGRMPMSSAEGVTARLVFGDAGRLVVRGATVVDAPVDGVWSVVSDEAKLGSVLADVGRVETEAGPDGLTEVRGRLSPWGLGWAWPFAVTVRHRRIPGGWRAAWDEPSGSFTVDRGTWTLTALDDRHTLVTLELDVEIAPFPAWLVRSVVLNRVGSWLRVVGRAAAG